MTNLGSQNTTQWTEISSSWIEIQTLCECPLHANPPGADPKINHLKLVRPVSSMQISLPI